MEQKLEIKDPKVRYEICKNCEKFFSPTRQCRECMCFMNVKTKVHEAECPLGKW
jgi:hypothetical protein